MLDSFLNSAANLSPAITIPVLFLILAWTLPWKGVALWKASRNGHKKWFVALLVMNTLAILEITYIFYFSKKPKD
ncbi:hypothetical protein KKB68_00330 [Patescibacteria group bacterium]|nr:hypothetical protein [Patescibacteria group bacterium]